MYYIDLEIFIIIVDIFLLLISIRRSATTKTLIPASVSSKPLTDIFRAGCWLCGGWLLSPLVGLGAKSDLTEPEAPVRAVSSTVDYGCSISASSLSAEYG